MQSVFEEDHNAHQLDFFWSSPASSNPNCAHCLKGLQSEQCMVRTLIAPHDSIARTWQACMALHTAPSVFVNSLLKQSTNADWMRGCLQVALLCAAGLRQQGYAALADLHKVDREELEAHADDHVKAAAFFKRAAGIYAHVAEQATTEEGQVQSLHCAGQRAPAHMLHSSLQQLRRRCTPV